MGLQVGSIYGRYGFKLDKKTVEEAKAANAEMIAGADKVGRSYDGASKRMIGSSSAMAMAAEKNGSRVSESSRRHSSAFAANWGHAFDHASHHARRLEEVFRYVMERLTFMATLAVGGTTFELIKGGIEWDSFAAKAQDSLGRLLKSGDKAKEFFNSIVEYSHNATSSAEELVGMSQHLLALGYNANQIIPTLQALGDAIAKVGGDRNMMDNAATQIARMQLTGKVTTRSMFAIAQTGINPWKLLAEQMGVSEAKVREWVNKGRLNGTQVAPMLLSSMESTSKGAMQGQLTNSFGGMFSKIKEQFTEAEGTIIKPFYSYLLNASKNVLNYMKSPAWAAGVKHLEEVVRTQVVPAIEHFWTALKKNWPAIKKGAEDVAHAFVTIARQALGVIHAVGGFEKAFKMILGGYLAVKLIEVYLQMKKVVGIIMLCAKEGRLLALVFETTLIGAVVAAVVLIILNWSKVKRWFEIMTIALPNMWKSALEAILGFAELYIGEVIKPFLWMIKTILEGFQYLGINVSSEIQALDTAMNYLVDNGGKRMYDNVQNIKSAWDAAASSIDAATSKANKAGTGNRAIETNKAPDHSNGALPGFDKSSILNPLKAKHHHGLTAAQKARLAAETQYDFPLSLLDTQMSRAQGTTTLLDDRKIAREQLVLLNKQIGTLAEKLVYAVQHGDKKAAAAINSALGSAYGARNSAHQILDPSNQPITTRFDSAIDSAQFKLSYDAFHKIDPTGDTKKYGALLASKIKVLEKQVRSAVGKKRTEIRGVLDGLYKELENINKTLSPQQMLIDSIQGFSQSKLDLIQQYMSNIAQSGAKNAAAGNKGGGFTFAPTYTVAPSDTHQQLREAIHWGQTLGFS